MSGVNNMGYAKIAFTYGFRILHELERGECQLNDKFYQNWMSWIIKRAGDTDTNAAISGGLMGSIVGFWGLPEKYVAKTLKTITDGRELII